MEARAGATPSRAVLSYVALCNAWPCAAVPYVNLTAIWTPALCIFSMPHQGTFDLMLFINVYSIPFCLTYLITNGELLVLFALSVSVRTNALPSVHFITVHSMYTCVLVRANTAQEIIMLVWLSLAGALGQMCIFYTIANFGALTCSLITTLRKMMQIGLSALAFGHTFTALQLVGVASSFTGVYVATAILHHY